MVATFAAVTTLLTAAKSLAELVAAAQTIQHVGCLNQIAPGLLQMLYRKPEEGDDDQPELDLDPDRLSKLAFPMLAQPLKWEKDYTGYKFVLHYGIDEKSNTTLADCQVDKWKFDCQDGGTVITGFRVIAHPEEDEIGHLCTQIQQSIVMSLIPPTAEYYKDGKLPGTGDE